MRYFPTVCPRKNICADEYTLGVRPRFYVPDADPAAAVFELPDDEAAHLLRVLRLGAGAQVEVFDGRGGVWRADVLSADKRSVTVRRHRPVTAAPETRVEVSVVVSVLKGDKMDDIVRDAVMIGAAAVQPVTSARSEVSLATVVRGHRVARWQRIAVSSAKQCRRAVVPIVRHVMPFDRYLAAATGAVRILCVEPGMAGASPRRVQDIPPPAAADVIIGPEGGWTADEVEAACAAGAIPVSLGGRTLRADAVPLVALTALLSTWREL
jgi:16S rRNA (uracil1498-N3)-methyltransferase